MSEPLPNPNIATNNAAEDALASVEAKVAWLRDRFREGSTPHQIAVDALAQMAKLCEPDAIDAEFAKHRSEAEGYAQMERMKQAAALMGPPPKPKRKR